MQSGLGKRRVARVGNGDGDCHTLMNMANVDGGGDGGGGGACAREIIRFFPIVRSVRINFAVAVVAFML